RRLADFLSVVRGLQCLRTEQPGAVNELIAKILVRAKSTHLGESTDFMKAAEDEQSFVEALTRRLAAHSTLRDIEFEFAPGQQEAKANIVAERLEDRLNECLKGI